MHYDLVLRNPVIVAALAAVLMTGCATQPRRTESSPASGTTSQIVDADEPWTTRERGALGVFAFGPAEIRDSPAQMLWMVTVGAVAAPITIPWYSAIRVFQGPAEARIAVIVPEGRFFPYGEWPVGEISVYEIEFGDYHAVVIGIRDYRALPNLETPLKDAAAIAALLRDDYKFRVEVLENATRAQIIRTLFELRDQLGHKDNLLIYYAGHGRIDPDTREGYWLPSDAAPNDPTNWIANSTISTALKALDAKHILVVADSCYSGSLTRDVPFHRSGNRHYIRLVRRKARLVLTSGGMEPVIDDGVGGHSVFAMNFMRILKENRGILESSALFLQVRRAVMEDARQIPEYGPIRFTGHDGGDFLFVHLPEH